MWWTEQAVQSWKRLSEPDQRQDRIFRATELLDEIDYNTAEAWQSAQEVVDPAITTRSIRRTLIELDEPSLWIYWSIESNGDAIVLDFIFDY
jgi:hypothetical protein